MRKSVFILMAVLLFILSSLAQAEEPDRIITNSEDWRDVYSLMLYGAIANKNTNFLVSDRHASLILGQIPTTEHLWIFSSTKTPFVVGYQSILNSKGYSAEEFKYGSINLEMAKRLQLKNYIIIDDSYGYNAIAVAPYATVSSSFVLFADQNNIDEIVSFLNTQNPEKIIIYGQVDREVRNALSSFNPETINKGGDRFANNIEIVKKYQEIKHAKQAVLTNGEFIEKEIMSGAEPVVFIGSSNVPNIIRDYIKGSDIQIGILIGNELVSTATFVRRQLGISVFVKFAQGARVPQGAISQVEALDMFYLPVYRINLEFDSAKYNRATNKLEITLKNTEDQAVYFIGTYTITASDGSKITVGDTEPVFIDGKELKTVIYDVENVPEGDLSGNVYIVYGESVNSLEKTIDRGITIESVRILDNCQISLNGLSFNTRRNLFYVEVENTGAATCYVDLELVDVVVAGDKHIMGYGGTAKLEPQEKKQLKLKADPQLLDEDLEDNPEIKVRAFYGERENSLIKVLEGKFELIISKTDYMFYALTALIVLLILLIVWKRRKKKEEKRHHLKV